MRRISVTNAHMSVWYRYASHKDGVLFRNTNHVQDKQENLNLAPDQSQFYIFTIVSRAKWRLCCERLSSRFLLWHLFLLGVVKDNVYVPALAKTLHKVKTRIREACANLITKFFVTCGRRLNIRLMLLQSLVAVALNCINL